MKYEEHPVLGVREKGRSVKIFFEGEEISAEEGEPVAVALLEAGIKDFRITRKKQEIRGVYCANGRCTDCMMVVDGLPNIRTCVTPVTDGMRVERNKTDIGGPAL